MNILSPSHGHKKQRLGALVHLSVRGSMHTVRGAQMYQHTRFGDHPNTGKGSTRPTH
ncbi:protein of unknown function [Paraburkholderia dioscoreae]|uniref:Uncharacterized protein n=1 Tax=Paraburkholderia dioscoreae TaxID=2604047 RepID=A0A5Q4Z8N0_9BURK|nr:protein of unknown function [Paraburkholderia dioscoreae]